MKVVHGDYLQRGLIYLLVIALSALLTFAVGKEVMAATEWSHLWNYSTFTVSTVSAGTMVMALNSASDNYNTGTDLSFGAGVITAYESNYGMNGWQGMTKPYNAAGQSCTLGLTAILTGFCNKTTNKATRSDIYFNSAYTPYSGRNWLARHEMGHVFGLWHGSCVAATPTVMNIPNCATLPSVLQADEINWINSKY